MPIVLGGDPIGKNFLYTNGNSVIIRDISVRMIIVLLLKLFQLFKDSYTEYQQK